MSSESLRWYWFIPEHRFTLSTRAPYYGERCRPLRAEGREAFQILLAGELRATGPENFESDPDSIYPSADQTQIRIPESRLTPGGTRGGFGPLPLVNQLGQPSVGLLVVIVNPNQPGNVSGHLWSGHLR
jgi:hypothetical protein